MAKWNIDPDHSVGSFTISHMTVAFVRGQMNAVSGTIYYDPGDFSSLDVDFNIAVESIITGVKKRDEHLKSADFFDIARYPSIHYKSTASEQAGFNSAKVSGELTIHGVKKKVTMDVYISGPVKSPFGETTMGITGRFVLDREEFGIDWNQPLENGGFMVGKTVNVSFDLEGDLETE